MNIKKQQEKAREHLKLEVVDRIADTVYYEIRSEDLDTIIAQTITDTCKAIKEGMPKEKELNDCNNCNACESVMTCTTLEGDRKVNQALQATHKVIDEIISNK